MKFYIKSRTSIPFGGVIGIVLYVRPSNAASDGIDRQQLVSASARPDRR